VQISSKILDTAVEQLSSLPGIGRRTALRLALHLLQRNELEIHDFAQAIIDLKLKVLHCNTCGNLADQKTCEICLNPNRNSKIVCVVEDIRDIIAIEATGAFKGKYHVLGGVISPMDGIGPNELNIEPLIIRVKNKEIDEIIFALSPTMEGDTTNFYLFKRLKEKSIKISSIARGIAIGDELEYTDEVTLGTAISSRLPYSDNIKTH